MKFAVCPILSSTADRVTMIASPSWNLLVISWSSMWIPSSLRTSEPPAGTWKVGVVLRGARLLVSENFADPIEFYC